MTSEASTVAGDTCPRCSAPWVTEVREADLTAPVPVLRRWEVRCAEGHAFNVSSYQGGLNYAVRLPELVTARPPGRVASPARADCVGCGEPFQAAQMYVPGPEPRHLGCRP